MSDSLKVAIVGGGIVGLAHAWSAAQRGHRVTLFERGSAATKASIRNFGMIWPIGQPPGEMYQIALESRSRWLKFATASGCWLNECGSIHLAHREDERSVLQEFCELGSELGYACKWLDHNEVLQKTNAANPTNLLGGLYSSTELGVNPRVATARLAAWLAEQYAVEFRFHTSISRVDAGSLTSADGKQWPFDVIIVCPGADLESLFPEKLAEANLSRCKLQMLKTAPQPNAWKLGPHVASGLTLRHYRNFEICPSLSKLTDRIATETPELDRFGIHVMASQNEAGELILGDSHEYDEDISPFDQNLIDELMIRELKKCFQFPDWSIVERWSGVYTKIQSSPCFESQPLPNVYLFTGVGGAGMTMSFGLAERFWNRFA